MTSAHPPQAVPIYPPYCHALSPTINKWAPLRATDVHALRDVDVWADERRILHYLNHPVKWVRVTGVIVAVDEFATRRVYTLDDSSGACVECVCPAPEPATTAVSSSSASKREHPDGKPKETGSEKAKEKEKGTAAQPSTMDPWIPWPEMDVGAVVKIKGKPSQFRGMVQLEIVKAEVVRGTEQEVKCWDEVGAFRKAVLGKPWALAGEEIEKCKVRAVKEGRKKVKEGQEGRVEAEKSAREESRKRKRDKEKEKEREKDGEGLGRGNKVNYPSLAARKKLAEQSKGKYDALGI